MRHLNYKRLLARWWLAALMMALIFALSSRPSSALPQFGWADTIVKKGGHVVGYGALAAGYWRALGWKPRLWWLALAMAVAFGMTDELHQVFVAGRHHSGWDVILFDAPGAALGLWLARRLSRARRLADA
jgi:VanZ family protein